MNDDEIRMEILFDHYNAMKNQTRLPYQEYSEKLKNIDKKDYDFNYGHLVKHNLVEGHVTNSDDGTEYFTPIGGITGLGMDIVEKYIKNSVEHVKNTANIIIKKTLSYVEQIVELVIIWSNNSNLFQQALEYFHSLIG